VDPAAIEANLRAFFEAARSMTDPELVAKKLAFIGDLIEFVAAIRRKL